jgi:hypothetical protein
MIGWNSKTCLLCLQICTAASLSFFHILLSFRRSLTQAASTIGALRTSTCPLPRDLVAPYARTPIDCVLSSNATDDVASACSASAGCGGGFLSRVPAILVPPANGGLQCPQQALEPRVELCAAQACAGM